MKLLAVLCCAAALVAADYPAPGKQPTITQLTAGLNRVYRRLIHYIAPKQQKIADALDIKPRDGVLASPIFTSSYEATYDGVVKHTFSHKYSYINPEQKGVFGLGSWTKNEVSEYVVTYHYGDAVKVHMLTTGGIHKEVVLGNPLDPDHEDAKFVVVVPKSTYVTFESLSEDEVTFVSYFASPALDYATAQYFTLQEMETKFPAQAELFHELAKPGVRHVRENPYDVHHGFDDKFGHHGRPDTYHGRPDTHQKH